MSPAQKSLECILMCIVGMGFPLILLCTGAVRFYRDIRVFAKGKKYSGICTGHTGAAHSQYNMLNVEWTDENGRQHRRHFHALRLHFRFPYPVSVYILDGACHLGWLTVLRSGLVFLAYLAAYAACVAGTVYAVAVVQCYM